MGFGNVNHDMHIHTPLGAVPVQTDLQMYKAGKIPRILSLAWCIQSFVGGKVIELLAGDRVTGERR